MLRAGTFLQERYEILERIGSGGMSVVYKARCHKLNRLVAIKVLKNEFSEADNFVSKFKMEAQAAAGLSHPNIVSVYDVVDEGELHYIVMELIEGITLKNYIVKKGYLGAKETIGIAIQVALGIAAAHEQRIVHRDIKPQNIIISKDGKAKVADFGIARAVSEQTLNSNAIGSVHYISPEQARGGYSDARSDIYSLGITMYEMVAGHVPFEGENTVAVALAHLEERMALPSVYNPEIPVGLERIILKCTEKKPENRYEHVGGVITDLRRVLLHPEEDIVAPEPKQRPLGETVMMSDEEMARIKEYQRPPERPYKKDSPVRQRGIDGPGYPELFPDVGRGYPESFPDLSRGHATPYPDAGRGQPEPFSDPNWGHPTPYPDAGRGNSPIREFPTERRARRPSGTVRRNEEDEGSRPIERLMAAGGVLVAILVVVVLVVVAVRLFGGIFYPFGTSDSPVVSAEPTSESEAGLDTTQIRMPAVLGLTEDIAADKLKESTLSMKRSYAYSDTVEAGYVISQSPDADAVVAKWSSVNVVISNGSDKVDLTKLDLLGMDGKAAKSLLESRKLVVASEEQEHGAVEAGRVIRFSPERVPEGGTVTLYISTGPHVEEAPVPALSGLPEEEAIARLGQAGLTPGNVTQENHGTVAAGHVIRQGIAAQAPVAVGSAVDYVVSLGPEQSDVRYIASINTTYDFSSLIGPGSPTADVTLMLRLSQSVGGTAVYTELMPPRTIRGDTLLPIQFNSIEGALGIEDGMLEVVEMDTGAVLKAYPLTFFPMD